MRSGDYIRGNSGAVWVVAYVFPEHMFPCLGEGRHVFILRDDVNADGDIDLVATLVAEDDIYLGWKAGPIFQKGDRFVVEGEQVEVHSSDAMFVFFRMDDRSLPCGAGRRPCSPIVRRR
ncbi:hypothetical protein EN866_33825 [Mesorhizobium sp. M2D.F.Ca.ET.223.01.1.1]|uniref:hypothetical protein n=1 Tax=Mesorhizobium sp. M2D.F.Ca.ET.223.01.1.1 TaxID=2563940 RepID=UPI0010922DAC|nr:hypothetical protein [Mesorhizobium sp. M2D.F.Ca.ET.223.01.1.1]TGR83607.1 hypothetical protein EN866_33825 [Mesorhizobium sp. M2D.F.Ca.ET.223.01.1.1]TGT74569.1 hypothetical protein EN802_12040 [bacterium M00.F.Ca.ET.159.01.1.1]TGT86819.1 hypothetical protein EN800_08930 [bacterium M00.F.Ca.ET.157.01.1.1]